MATGHTPEKDGGGNGALALARDLGQIDATPGWQEIKDTAFSQDDTTGNIFAGLFKGIRLFGSVTAASVERNLVAEGSEERKLQEAWITHTVGFAKNVLEAESAAYSRASVQGLDLADISPTGEHAIFKAAAERSRRDGDAADAAAKNVIDGRTKLPVVKPDGIWLNPADLVVFYAMAELYGMARAGYDPKRLPDYLFASGVTSVPVRTRAFLANQDRVLDILGPERSPLATLESVGVSVPEAIQIADSPTVNTIMSTAREIAANRP